MDTPNNNIDLRANNSDMNTILIIVILLILIGGGVWWYTTQSQANLEDQPSDTSIDISMPSDMETPTPTPPTGSGDILPSP